jgi:hypothetical protein
MRTCSCSRCIRSSIAWKSWDSLHHNGLSHTHNASLDSREALPICAIPTEVYCVIMKNAAFPHQRCAVAHLHISASLGGLDDQSRRSIDRIGRSSLVRDAVGGVPSLLDPGRAPATYCRQWGDSWPRARGVEHGKRDPEVGMGLDKTFLSSICSSQRSFTYLDVPFRAAIQLCFSIPAGEGIKSVELD